MPPKPKLWLSFPWTIMIDSLLVSLSPISLLQSILDTIVKVILIKKYKIYHVIHLLDIFRYLPSSFRVKSNTFTLTRKTWPHPLRFCWPQLLSHHPSPDSSHTNLPGTLTPHIFCTFCILTLKCFITVCVACFLIAILSLFSSSHLLPWGIADVLFMYFAYCLPLSSPK